MKILVTGGTGFIGSNLANRLVDLGHEVYVTGREPNKSKGIFIGDSHINTNFDVCFHQAANNNTLDTNEKEVFDFNLNYSINLFKNLYKNGCKKIIYASTTAVYGNQKVPFNESQKTSPLNLYAKSKLELESFCNYFSRNNKINLIGLRYCNVYGFDESNKGPRASMIYHIYKSLSESYRPLIFKYGQQKRDWCYVKDVVDANVFAMNYNDSNVFNIAGGNSVTFYKLLEIMNKIMKTYISPKFIDCNFLDQYQIDTTCDISKAEKELNWKPKFSLQEGIRDYLDCMM